MNDDVHRLVTALTNTTVAMLTLLKQMHFEFGHGYDDDECPLCAQYIAQSRSNRELVEEMMRKQ